MLADCMKHTKPVAHRWQLECGSPSARLRMRHRDKLTQAAAYSSKHPGWNPAVQYRPLRQPMTRDWRRAARHTLAGTDMGASSADSYTRPTSLINAKDAENAPPTSVNTQQAPCE